ncbi:fimbrial protein [Burkholderia sp. SIMBA_062]|uniref:fimbrial protein n=1 Tax=Burkholderia sp. SIMBA_062 TaxID=3085803 RepID=UPI00397C0EE5
MLMTKRMFGRRLPALGRIMAGGLLCAAAIFSSASEAREVNGCYVKKDGVPFPTDQNGVSTVNIDGLPGSVQVDPNSPNGTVIYTAYSQPGSYEMGCTALTFGFTLEFSTGGRLSETAGGQPNVYTTTVPGIGVRISVADILSGAYWPVSTSRLRPAVFYTQLMIKVELIKIGAITSGGSIGYVGKIIIPDYSQRLLEINMARPIAVRPVAPTCKVQTPAIQASLGTVFGRSLEGGATSSAVPFNIRLLCSGAGQISGTPGKALTYITLTDATNPGNRSDMLSLSSDSTATGVGIQILRSDGSIVSYGPESSAEGNPNQWYVGEYGNGTVDIPLKARYAGEGGKVGPGSANGLATFTMSYQ